jgi:hypothetical protein
MTKKKQVLNDDPKYVASMENWLGWLELQLQSLKRSINNVTDGIKIDKKRLSLLKKQESLDKKRLASGKKNLKDWKERGKHV